MRRFALTPVSLQVLPDASHSYVYDCHRDGAPYILKITHTIHRQPHNILGELEFINFLADGGVTVPRAIPSINGNLVETIPPNNPRHSRASGNPPSTHHSRAACPRPRSGSGNPLAEDENFIAVTYEKAPGALVDWRTWTPQHVRAMGRNHRQDARPHQRTTIRRTKTSAAATGIRIPTGTPKPMCTAHARNSARRRAAPATGC